MYRHVETPGSVPLTVEREAGADPAVRPLTPGMLAAMILQRKALVAVCGLVFATVGLAFGVLAPPKYIAYSQLIIDPTDLRVTERSLRTPSQFSDALVAQVENQVRVITSASVLDRVIAAQRLDEDEEFNGKAPSVLAEIRGALRGLFGGSGTPRSEASPDLAARRVLEQTIGAKRDERTYVVNVSAKTGEPEKSVRITDAVVDAYIAETAEARDAVSKKIAGSLNDRIGELKGAVEQAERRVEEYRRKNNLVSAVGSNVTEQQLADASTRLQTAQSAMAQAQSRYQQVLASKGSGDVGAIPAALQSNTVMNLRTQVTEVQRRMSDLMATRGPRHPEVTEIRAQEATVRRALGDELARIATTAKTDLERAKADEREMLRSFDTLKTAVNMKDEASVRLREFERDADASRSVYEAFMKRTKEVSEQVKIDVANIRVISPAQQPERRSFPPRTLLLVLGGLVLGLLLGAGVAMLRGLTRGEIEQPRQRRRMVRGMALVRP